MEKLAEIKNHSVRCEHFINKQNKAVYQDIDENDIHLISEEYVTDSEEYATDDSNVSLLHNSIQ